MAFAAAGNQEELVEVGEHGDNQHQVLQLLAEVADLRDVHLYVLASAQRVQVWLEKVEIRQQVAQIHWKVSS